MPRDLVKTFSRFSFLTNRLSLAIRIDYDFKLMLNHLAKVADLKIQDPFMGMGRIFEFMDEL